MKKEIKKFFSKGDKVRMGYGAAFLLLLISLGLTFSSVRYFIGQSKQVSVSNKTIVSLEQLVSVLRGAETGFRGYMIMRDEKFLEPYNHAEGKANDLLAVLKTQTEDNIVQSKSLDRLKNLIGLNFRNMGAGIAQYKRGDQNITDTLRFIAKQGKTTMDSIRATVYSMQEHENGLMEMTTSKMSSTSKTIQLINIAALVVSILIAFYSIRTYTHENNARVHADEIADEYQAKLEQQVAELSTVNSELVTLKRNEKFASTGRIARTIAHEVRNPLTNINLAVEQLKEDIGEDKEDSRSLLEMIERNSTRINQLVTELLNSTKFTELNFAKNSINTLLDQALAMSADRIQLNQVTVVKSYSADICDIEVDESKIMIAFLNIIVNAIEAMEPGKGILKLRTAGESDHCNIYISDNGHGMDEDALQRLFEPYFTKKPKGNGLGMTNTQNIILNHKGTIRVESEVNKGTTFIISLRFPD